MLSGGRKPSVAAIDGLALGGGLEIALVCMWDHSFPVYPALEMPPIFNVLLVLFTRLVIVAYPPRPLS